MRQATIQRDTAETSIRLTLALDGQGKTDIQTGSGFLDHMLTLLASHGRFDLALACKGDIEVDYHHSVEDCGIALGQAFAKALGEGRGITRYGSFLLPMDEALVLVALDISGRCHLTYDVSFLSQRVGGFDVELAEEFFLGLCRSLGLTLHIRQLSGTNTHHILEAAFKGLGRALGIAAMPDSRRQGEIPSTKGTLL